MTKLDNDDCTIFRSADAGRLVMAATCTIETLHQLGHVSHAEAIDRSMGDFLRGGPLGPLKTLYHWLELMSDAYDLLWDGGEKRIADETSEVAGFCICKVIRALEAGAVTEAANIVA
ncbi:type III secretion system chaperone family protein [Limimaricola litoreus]|uniref:Uncharacterized protein n=1 Tax=Limimaricola litoreus TaxID=2955316 RepID=A0A9X2FR00_9RHOB|nr:hypothetical protein [Limimaricola litoreus]MCP1168905.1 hypothetical protein [Limimaricola litoreus]